MDRRISAFIRRIRERFFFTINHFYDMRICGQSLSEYIPSLYRDDENGVGMTGSQSTYYPILKKIFSNVVITEKDSFLDVGCGMGRVLAFCVREKYPCLINGIEINEVPGKIAQSWSKKYDNVHVTIGDAFKIDYNQYTVLFLGRPFLPVTFSEFIQYLESQLTHPIKFIYWVDQQSGHLLMNRAGWTLKRREKIKRIYGVKLPGNSQWYSIWEYDPGTKKKDMQDEPSEAKPTV